jgi:hypothetical protein
MSFLTKSWSSIKTFMKSALGIKQTVASSKTMAEAAYNSSLNNALYPKKSPGLPKLIICSLPCDPSL